MILIFLFILLPQVMCFNNQAEIGITFSIIGLFFVLPSICIFKTPLRVLDYLQIMYLFSDYLINSGYKSISQQFSTSWTYFIPNLYQKYSDQGDFVDTAGSALSVGTILVGLILLLYIIQLVLKKWKPYIRFRVIYNSLKGFLRWIYLNLCANSIKYIMMSSTGQISNTINNAIIPKLIFSICVLFPICQVIILKLMESQTTIYPREKWIQFVSYYKLLLIGIFVKVPMPKNSNIYLGYIALSVSSLIILIFHRFYRTMDRIIAGITYGSQILIYSFYAYNSNLVSTQIDSIIITLVVCLEFIYQILRLTFFFPHFHPRTKQLARQIELKIHPFDSSLDELKQTKQYEQQIKKGELMQKNDI